MREQLVQYVNLLFAGNSGAEEMKQEILQNTLDRFDDLLSRGSSEEEAYRQAIAGIGDVGELLGRKAPGTQQADYNPLPGFEGTAPAVARMLRAVAIFLYIVSPVPLILFDALGWDTVGLCITLVIVAIATLLLLTFGRSKPAQEAKREEAEPPVVHSPTAKKNLKKSIGSLISTAGLVLYFVISFSTHAWLVTWLIFPITGAVRGVVNACIDLKEGE